MTQKIKPSQLLSLLITCAIAAIAIPIQVFAQAQTKITEIQINRYAAAVYEIDKKREDVLRRAKSDQAWAEVAQLAEKNDTEVCQLDQSLRSGTINRLCEELFDYSEAKIREHGFANNREFNQITIAQKQDLTLQGRIQARLMQLRGFR